MIKSELSKKAIELAKKDGWELSEMSGHWDSGGWFEFLLTTKQLILMHRNLAKRELSNEAEKN